MKQLNFNTEIHDTRQLQTLAAEFERAKEAAAGFESKLLALQVGAVGLMTTLAGLAKLLGLSFSSGDKTSEKQLKSVGRAAKQAKKELMAFDELNRLDAPASGGSSGSGITAQTGEPLEVESYMDTVHRLTIYMSGAALALGAILAFSGANVPLGLGLMAAGAVGLAAMAAENWDSMTPGVRSAMTQVLALLGGAALAVGAILAFSGANIPLGIGLMAAGAAGLAGAAALNWDYIPGKLRQVWDSVKSWWRGSVAPCLTLGFWMDKFSAFSEGLKTKIKDGVNGGIALMNRFIAWVNRSLFLSWGGLSAFGKTIIPAGSFQLLTIPQIPMLAKGAVIPPNAPFAAILGDQTRGNNIETPEALLRQIVREESESELMREQNALLRQILEKTGVYLDGKTLSDTVTRYQSRQSRAMGV